jgi:hypothetical protein
MKLIIGTRKEIIFLELKKEVNDIIIDRNEWSNDSGSSDQLLKRLDSFLAKNKTAVQNLSVVETKIDEKQKYTLTRIIKAVANTINYCLK